MESSTVARDRCKICGTEIIYSKGYYWNYDGNVCNECRDKEINRFYTGSYVGGSPHVDHSAN